MVVEAAAIGDLALRTAVASVLSTTVTPAVIATAVRSGGDRDNLRFYAELAAARDPAKSFPAPTGWPYDLADDGLVDSIKDSEGIPSTRFNALLREAKRRGLRVAAPRSTVERAPRPGPGPEIFRRPSRS